MYAHLKQQSKQNTKQRNSKKMLVEQKKWIEIDELVPLVHKEYKKVMQLEERSRMLFFKVPVAIRQAGRPSTHSSQVKISSAFVTFCCSVSPRFARR
jgi:hypothetical protein